MEASLKDIMQFIVDLGVLVVIAGIFLYTAIRIINIFLKHLENKFRYRNHDKLLDIRSNVNQEIQSLITEYLADHDGDRVHVIEFSNSVTSVAYLPFKYMNCMYEVFKIGKSSTAKNIDRLSTSLFTDFFSRMYKSEYVILDDTNPEECYGGAIYDLMHRGGERFALCAVIKTARGKSLGYVALKQNRPFDQCDIDDILILADKIAALLGIMDK